MPLDWKLSKIIFNKNYLGSTKLQKLKSTVNWFPFKKWGNGSTKSWMYKSGKVCKKGIKILLSVTKAMKKAKASSQATFY